jgi:hypothetical protein
MPKSYLTLAEREKSEYIKIWNKQIKAIDGELATTKHRFTISEIEKKVDFSRQVTQKVRNKPEKATLEQLCKLCYAVGKRVVITIE